MADLGKTMKPAKQLFITCAFAAAAASALVLIGVRSAETPNLGELDEDGAKVCIIADDCTWGEQIPDEFAGTIEIKPGVTLKQFRKDIQDVIDALNMVEGSTTKRATINRARAPALIARNP